MSLPRTLQMQGFSRIREHLTFVGRYSAALRPRRAVRRARIRARGGRSPSTRPLPRRWHGQTRLCGRALGTDAGSEPDQVVSGSSTTRPRPTARRRDGIAHGKRRAPPLSSRRRSVPNRALCPSRRSPDRPGSSTADPGTGPAGRPPPPAGAAADRRSSASTHVEWHARPTGSASASGPRTVIADGRTCSARGRRHRRQRLRWKPHTVNIDTRPVDDHRRSPAAWHTRPLS